MISNILDNTTELWMTKYIICEIFSSGGATLYKNPSDQTVILLLNPLLPIFTHFWRAPLLSLTIILTFFMPYIELFYLK